MQAQQYLLFLWQGCFFRPHLSMFSPEFFVPVYLSKRFLVRCFSLHFLNGLGEFMLGICWNGFILPLSPHAHSMGKNNPRLESPTTSCSPVTSPR